MGWKLKEGLAPPPPKKYTILDALKDLALRRRRGVLMLVNIKTQAMYHVKKHDVATGNTVMYNEYGNVLTPVIGKREEEQYEPMWRD